MSRFLRAKRFGPDSTASASITGSLPSHKSGDLLIAHVGTRVTGVTISETGLGTWSTASHINSVNTSGVFYKFASSSSEPTPTFSHGGAADNIYGEFIVFEDVDSTTPFPQIATTFASNSQRLTSNTVLTTDDGCLILYLAHSDQGLYGDLFEPPARQLFLSDDNAVVCLSGAVMPMQTAGTTPAAIITLAHTTDISCHTLALKTASVGLDGAVLQTSTPAEIIHPIYNFNNFYGGIYNDSSERSSDPTTIITSIDGTATITATPFSNNRFAPFRDCKDYPPSMLLNITASSQYDKPVIRSTKFSTSHPLYNTSGIDISNSLISIRASSTSDVLNDYATGGNYVGLISGDLSTGKASIFKIEAGDTQVKSNLYPFPFVFDTSKTEYEAGANGAADLTNVSRLMLGVNQNTDVAVRWGYMYKLGTIPIVAGNSTNPATPEAAYEFVQSNGLGTIVKHGGLGNAQYYVNQSVQVGNGSTSTPVYYKGSGTSVEFPYAFDEAGRSVQSNVAQGAFSWIFYPGASCHIDISNQVFDMGDLHSWGFHASSNSSATIITDGAVVQNSGPISLPNLGADRYTNITFNACGQLSGGADMTGANDAGNTVSNSQATYAVLVTSQAEFEAWQNNAFIGNNYSIQITGNHGGETWTGTGMTVTGGTGSYDIEYTGTGTLTLEMDAGSGWSTARATETGGGTLTVTTPTITLTVSSNIASSDIKIFNTGTKTIEAQATGTSASTTTAGTYSITVMKAGYIPQRRTGVVLGTTANVDVDITLVPAPIYNASHGIAWSATSTPGAGEIHFDTGSRILYIGDARQGRDIYSALIDFFISQSALDNEPFPIVAVGPDRFDFTSDGTTAATIDSGDIQYWKGAGMAWEHATTGNDTHRFFFARSVGDLGGTVFVGYQQTDGGTVNEVTLDSGVVGECIQYYSDTNGDGTPDYNYESHLVFKAFAVDHYIARNDILESFGISVLEPYEYTFVLENIATGLTSGDQSLTLTITDQQAAPVEEQTGYTYSYKVTEASAGASPEAIMAQWLYDLYTTISGDPTATYQSKLAFNWPMPIVESGGSYSSVYQYVEGVETTIERHGFYFEESGAYHPDFTQQQEDEDSGSGFFVTPILAQISVTGMPDAVGASCRLQISNETAKSASTWATGQSITAGDIILRSTGVGTENTAGLYFRAENSGTTHATTEPTWNTTPGGTTTDNDITWTTYKVLYQDADPASTSYSSSYTNGDEFKTGETYRLRFAEMDGATSFKTYETTGVVSASGFSVPVSVTADSVYANNAIDGSSITNFTADYTDNEIDASSDVDSTIEKAFAWYCYNLTTTQGMHLFWGTVTAIDEGNYRNNTSVARVRFDNTTTGSVSLQGSGARFFADDGQKPYKDPTTSGYGVYVTWELPVYSFASGGSGFTSSDRATLAARSSHTAADVVTAIEASSAYTTLTGEVSEIHQDAGLDSANPVTIAADGSRNSTDIDVDATDNGDDTITLARQ